MESLLYLIGIAHGVIIGYFWFAPVTPFKKAFIDGLSLRGLWQWLRKKEQ